MPSDGVELSPKEHILTDDEVIRLSTLFVRSGVSKIRLTGGEPTVRNDIVNIVGQHPALPIQYLLGHALNARVWQVG
jgi:cyclic pyranopterin phosphate synthase